MLLRCSSAQLKRGVLGHDRTSLGSWTSWLGAPLRELQYSAQMVAFLVRSRGSIEGMRAYFLHRTRDSSGDDTYQWEGPWPSDCVVSSLEIDPKIAGLDGLPDPYRMICAPAGSLPDYSQITAVCPTPILYSHAPCLRLGAGRCIADTRTPAAG